MDDEGTCEKRDPAMKLPDGITREEFELVRKLDDEIFDVIEKNVPKFASLGEKKTAQLVTACLVANIARIRVVLRDIERMRVVLSGMGGP
jgi:hypothetical protein